VREENIARPKQASSEQLDLFTDYEALAKARKREAEKNARERRMQETILAIKKRYGKNSVLKGLNYADGATAKDRNKQIGGHKA
jgi:DNA polymerase V